MNSLELYLLEYVIDWTLNFWEYHNREQEFFMLPDGVHSNYELAQLWREHGVECTIRLSNTGPIPFNLNGYQVVMKNYRPEIFKIVTDEELTTWQQRKRGAKLNRILK